MRTIFKTILLLVIFVAAAFTTLIIYAVISDYRPPETVIISENEQAVPQAAGREFNLLTWNIGYCGLDKDMDFFYDGGKKVFTPEETCAENLTAVKRFLENNDSVNFILLQEVDRRSRRSYRTDQYNNIAAAMKSFKGFFATNYDVFFVPVPLSSPMGKVNSGISTFTEFIPSQSIRYSFPGNYGFPKQLFMLDRCFLVNRFQLTGGKELVLINTHNEAFDAGEIRKTQMEYLKAFINGEYSRGNYVIAGGDWNQCPPGFRPEFSANRVNTDQMVIPSDYLPGNWKWVYDSTTPSNRTVISAYDPATTTTTVIDFFLLSPNVEPEYVKCIDLGFRNSDHNPVIIRIKLEGD